MASPELEDPLPRSGSTFSTLQTVEGSRCPSHHLVRAAASASAWPRRWEKKGSVCVKVARPRSPPPPVGGLNADVSSPPQGADKRIKMPDGTSLLEYVENADIKALLQ